MVLDGALIVIALITAVVVWLRWNFGHWRKRGIPYVEPNIIFGNMKEAMIGKIHGAILSQRIYNAFPNEPVVGFFRMRSPVLQIKDMDLIKAILIRNFNSFRNTGMSISKEADPILGRNPFFLKDEEWSNTRRIQTNQHTASKLKTLYGYVDEVKDELVAYVNNNLGMKFVALEFCTRFTIDIVSSCVFGIKTNSHTDERSEFRKRADNIVTPNWRSMLRRMGPKIIEKFRIQILNKKSSEYFFNLVKSVVEMRKEKNLTRADFIQNLINDKSENLSLIDMTAQTMTFFIDGYLVSANEMSFMLYMIAIHPEVQKRLRKELNSFKELDFDTLHHLEYLDAVFNETLRLYPPAIALSRECNQDTTINVNGNKYEFKVGDLIEIPAFAIHRDPQHFKNPFHFYPDRFLSEPNNPAALLTFSVGPRACPGSRFAKTVIKAGIAALVQNYTIVPGTNDWSMPTVTNNKSILLSSDSEMSVKFEKLSVRFER